MKRGFTLIELLAVIVILAIIALIAVPIVLNIIDDTKEKAFEQTINGIVKSANIKSTMELKTEEILYKYENNKWGDNKLNIDGQTPKYVEIKVNKKGQTRYAITDGKYCATKEYDSKINIKKIGNENNDKKIEEDYCKLDALLPTDEFCFKYNESSDSISISDYYCYEGNYKGMPVIEDLVIPEKINGKKVTAMAQFTFAAKGLKSVVIPDSITRISAYAFRGNKLDSVVFGKNVRIIENYAFLDNRLTNIIIPDSVFSIGIKAFASNQLTSIELPNSITSIEDSAFVDNQLTDNQAFIYNRKSDGSIDYSSLNSYGGAKRENVIIPEGITYIGEGAFVDNQITSVIIPSSVTSIGDSAFVRNQLTSIVIPSSITSIGDSVFYDNQLTSIEIPNSVTSIGGSAFKSNQLTNVTIKGKKSVNDFTEYPSSSPFGWASGYSDSNIIWEGSN